VHKELELWQFVAERLARNESVMLLVVAESSGSSPGRAGYKMAVGSDRELFGSIGGGVMEVNLVEQSRLFLRDAAMGRRGDAEISRLSQQVHRKDVQNSSGMICSGSQTVIFRLLTPADLSTVDEIVLTLADRRDMLTITSAEFSVGPNCGPVGKREVQGGNHAPAAGFERWFGRVARCVGRCVFGI